MRFFRSVVISFSFLFFGTGALFYNFLIFPLMKLFLKNEKYAEFSSKLINRSWVFFIKYLEIIGLIKVNIKSKEDFQNIKNKIIVATHPSFIDIVILISLIPKSTCFVKNALTKNFVLNNIVNSIFIPNDIELEELKNETKKYLDMGFNIIIFPAGTRHRKDEHPKIKKGASLISLNAKKDIVPVKIETSEDFLYIHQPFWRAGKRRVEFTIEVSDTIEIEEFLNQDEIAAKRNITRKITESFYN